MKTRFQTPIEILVVVLGFLAVIAFGVVISGCGTTAPPSPGSTPAPSPAQPISALDLGLIQTGATVATGAVLNFAVTQPSTRTRLANEIYSSANFIYKASGGTPPAPADFSAGLIAYGQAGDVQYAQYTSALSALYSTYYAKYVTNGSVGTQNFAAVLNAFAAGAEAGAASYATIPAPTPPSTTFYRINPTPRPVYGWKNWDNVLVAKR